MSGVVSTEWPRLRRGSAIVICFHPLATVSVASNQKHARGLLS